MEGSNTAVVLLNDLMFRVKIEEALKRVGFIPLFTSSAAEARQSIQAGAQLAVIDLNYSGARPLEVISELKSDPHARSVHLLAYVSHVQTDLRKAAEERGCDQVIARSALIPALLRIAEYIGEEKE